MSKHHAASKQGLQHLIRKVMMKSIFFYGCMALALNAHCQKTLDMKSRLMVDFLRSASNREDLKIYAVYPRNDSVLFEFERFIRKSLKHSKELSSSLLEIYNDDFYQTYSEKQIKTSGCISVFESDPTRFEAYLPFATKLQALNKKVASIIAKDPRLIYVFVYSHPDEFVLLRKSFLFGGVIEQRHNDDSRYRSNLMQMMVLWRGEGFGTKYLATDVNYVGMAEAKCVVEIVIPVIEKGVYICDVSFAYFKDQND